MCVASARASVCEAVYVGSCLVVHRQTLVAVLNTHVVLIRDNKNFYLSKFLLLCIIIVARARV